MAWLTTLLKNLELNHTWHGKSPSCKILDPLLDPRQNKMKYVFFLIAVVCLFVYLFVYLFIYYLFIYYLFTKLSPDQWRRGPLGHRDISRWAPWVCSV